MAASEAQDSDTITDKKDLGKRVAELEAELEEERAYSKNADRWIDILFDNLEYMLADMRVVDETLVQMEMLLRNGDNMAAGFILAKAYEQHHTHVNAWDYDGCHSMLRKLRDGCGYTFVDRKGWIPKGVYDAECNEFEYPTHPREGRGKT